MNVNKVSLFTAAQTSASKAQSPSFGKWDMKSHDYFMKNDNDDMLDPRTCASYHTSGNYCERSLSYGPDEWKTICPFYAGCNHAALRVLRDTDDVVITMGPKGKPVASFDEKDILRKIKLRKNESWRYFLDPELTKACKEGMSSANLRELASDYVEAFVRPPEKNKYTGPILPPDREEPPGMWNIGLD